MGGTHPVPQAARNACYACTTQPFEAVTLEHEPTHYNYDELFVSELSVLLPLLKGSIIYIIIVHRIAEF